MSNNNGSAAIIPVANNVWGMKHVFVNFYMVKSQDSEKWFLVDGGLKWSASKIKNMATTLFGADSRPEGIILTHGHFDHVGSINALAEEWDVPVYAHFMEIPFLTGKSSYPPPDSTVGGGMMSTMAFAYPNEPINIWNHINVLPGDGTLPGFPEWQVIHTPGHTPGHVSLFRKSDKVLIAGDAFVTTKAESALFVLLSLKKLSGPPKYFTSDWQAAKQSVETLHSLEPKVAATGHGLPMKGRELTDAMLELSQHFDRRAVPNRGRYVYEPAIADTNGIVYVPARDKNNNDLIVKVAAITAGLVVALMIKTKKTKKKKIKNETLLNVEYNF